MKKLVALGSLCLALAGCSHLNAVVTTTQTGLGVSLSENPTTQLYEARLGYFRNEFAFVPGNTNEPSSVPDVIEELRIQNIFQGGSIYQRLCVGKNAVQQPGAAVMFMKDANGNILTNVIQAVTQYQNFMLKPAPR